jgi:hypothetical protein
MAAVARRLAAVAVAAVVGIAGGLVVATPANAYLELYQNANDAGYHEAFFDTSVSWYGPYTFNNGGAGLNDNVSAFYNNSGHNVCLYTDVNYAGEDFGPITDNEYVPWVGSHWNDRFSSHIVGCFE